MALWLYVKSFVVVEGEARIGVRAALATRPVGADRCGPARAGKNAAVLAESLLVVRDLGLQIRTRFALGAQRSRFVDRAHLADIILNEGITYQSVIFYLAVVVQGEDRLLVVFNVSRACTGAGGGE